MRCRALPARFTDGLLPAVTRMRIAVDYDQCEANAVCMGIVPEVFEVGDDDQLTVLQETPPGNLLDQVRQAVDSCPKRALSLHPAAPN